MLNNQSTSNNKELLLFKIISAHISENDETEKKFVIYTLQVRHITRRDDLALATIDRRYTQFLTLYNDLINEFPNLMSSVSFPKKALIGNFDNKLIATRSSAFESLLKHIMSEPALSSSKSLLTFLQEPEITKAKQLISHKQFSSAIPILENNFTLLNNIYTDRSPPVLLALCRLLACSIATPGSPHSLKWAELALHRFDGVSDSDILVLYIPLLFLCIKVCGQNGKDISSLEQRLLELKRQGINCVDNISLLDAITKVELKMSGNC